MSISEAACVPAPFSWFPGHMLRAEREIRRQARLIDLVIETGDARAPLSSRSQKLHQIISRKPHVLALMKCDLADPVVSAGWQQYWNDTGLRILLYDRRCRRSAGEIRSAISRYAGELKTEKKHGRRAGGCIRAIVVGAPNTGKSTLINILAGRRKTATGARPGVTRSQQWIHVDDQFELLDTPGVLTPRIPDLNIAMLLVALAVIKDEIADEIEVAGYLVGRIKSLCPDAIRRRYNLDHYPENIAALLTEVGVKCGLLRSGGDIDMLNVSRRMVHDFRHGKFGRMTFEAPPG